MNLGSRRCCINNLIKSNDGPQGANGSYGPIGIIGNTGMTGNTGLQGETGLCYKGYKGPQGDIGPQGGLTGNTGPEGPIGKSGPTQSSKYAKFNFTIQSGSTYNSLSFTELTYLASTNPISGNTITLTAGNYSINFEINESWADVNNQFYIQLFDGSTYYSSYVFDPNPTKLTYLVLKTNESNLYGIGNDFISIPGGTYTFKLFQSTTSSSPIQIGGQNVNFSIAFVKLSFP
jgi:hypothetical protein